MKKVWRKRKEIGIGKGGSKCQHVEEGNKCARRGDSIAKDGRLLCNYHLVQFNRNKKDSFEDENTYGYREIKYD